MPVIRKGDIDFYIINKVKSMRNEISMSQAVLAIKLNVSQAFIGNVENPNHRAKYNLTHVNELAKIFKCSPRELLPEDPL